MYNTTIPVESANKLMSKPHWFFLLANLNKCEMIYVLNASGASIVVKVCTLFPIRQLCHCAQTPFIVRGCFSQIRKDSLRF